MIGIKNGILTKVFYMAFIVAISFGGNYHIGVTTPRQIFAVLMFILCLINYNAIKPFLKNILGAYVLYLFFVFLSAYNDNSVDSFIRNLIAQHFVALVCYGAITYYFVRFRAFDTIVLAFLICGVANMAVSFLQYFGHPLGFLLGGLFIDTNELMANRHMEMLMDGTGSYLLGMKGDAVHNGYFQMFMPFLMTYVHEKNIFFNKTNVFRNLFYYTLLALLFICILLIQERSCILFSLFTYMVFLYFKFKHFDISKKVLICAFGFIFLFFCVYLMWPVISEYIDNSRFVGRDDDLRENLLMGTFKYISENVLLGGMSSFVRQYDFPPHNIFLNAFVEAGICGFFLSIFIYFKQMKMAFSLAKIRVETLICYAFIAYMLNSMLHNDSILTGDVIVWILWGMVYSTYKTTYCKKYK